MCIPELEESAERVGGDIEGVDKHEGNGVVLWEYLQVTVTYSDSVWQWNLGGVGGNVGDPGGV